jgi:hypothetical protein
MVSFVVVLVLAVVISDVPICGCDLCRNFRWCDVDIGLPVLQCVRERAVAVG